MGRDEGDERWGRWGDRIAAHRWPHRKCPNGMDYVNAAMSH